MSFKVIFTTAAVAVATALLGGVSAHAQTPSGVKVVVEPGDSLSAIAEAHDTTYQRIFNANESVADPDVINLGQKLRIPAADEQLPERALPASTAPAAESLVQPEIQTSSDVVPAAPVAETGVWDQLAQCESSGNWSINTGNGYSGGLQFVHSTWIANGGGNYAPMAHEATREQQIAVAETIRGKSGFNPWPACADKLGLR